MRLIDADALPRYGNRGGLVNWYDIEKAPTVDAWEYVYDELIKVAMFIGIYDAKHGNKHFMYGISTVMEYIANCADKEDEFDAMFMQNMKACEVIKDIRSIAERKDNEAD